MLIGTRNACRDTVAFMEEVINGIIYLVGLIVVIMAILPSSVCAEQHKKEKRR